MGEPGQAATHFEDALAFCRNAGYRPELAWTCHDYAEGLLGDSATKYGKAGSRTGLAGASNQEKVKSLLEEGMSIAADLGMAPLMERIAALQEAAAAGPQPSPTYPNGLTRREVEVLLHLSQGKTNREIARELVLSERTVQRHISNLYTKINVRNRAEATTFALSQLAPSTQTFPTA